MGTVIGVLVGVVLGLVAGWGLARARSSQQSADLTASRAVALERAQAAERRVLELQEDERQRSADFEALAGKVLASTSRSLLDQADERFKRAHQASEAELAKREEAVRQMVEPLRTTLGDVRREVTAAEKARTEAHAALQEQVAQMRSSSELLRSETTQLVTALRAPHVRGRWGELQLRRVVEAAGMLAHVDFDEQVSVTTDDGALRPDLVVHLPGDKHVVVDAKTPFSGYLEAMEAGDEATRKNRLDAHARHVRKHIDDLHAKQYWDQVVGSPEYVVMFLPAETFLQAALEQDPGILENAFEKNIVLATPATLVAVLRTVAYTWRQEQLTSEAQQVLSVGKELHKRLGTMGGHLKTLSSRINGVVTAFNAFNTSLDRNVVTQARRFSDLQGLDASLEAPPPLEVLAVPAQKEDVYTAPETLEAGTSA